jgi:hypothetical protein
MDPATLDLVLPEAGQVEAGAGVASDANVAAAAADRAEARRSWRSAAAVARIMGCPLARDLLAATVYTSSESECSGGDGAGG